MDSSKRDSTQSLKERRSTAYEIFFGEESYSSDFEEKDQSSKLKVGQSLESVVQKPVPENNKQHDSDSGLGSTINMCCGKCPCCNSFKGVIQVLQKYSPSWVSHNNDFVTQHTPNPAKRRKLAIEGLKGANENEVILNNRFINGQPITETEQVEHNALLPTNPTNEQNYSHPLNILPPIVVVKVSNMKNVREEKITDKQKRASLISRHMSIGNRKSSISVPENDERPEVISKNVLSENRRDSNRQNINKMFDDAVKPSKTLSSNLSKKRSASSLPRTRHIGETLEFDSDCSEGHKQKVETINIAHNRKGRSPKKRQKRSRQSMPNLTNFDATTDGAGTYRQTLSLDVNRISSANSLPTLVFDSHTSESYGETAENVIRLNGEDRTPKVQPNGPGNSKLNSSHFEASADEALKHDKTLSSDVSKKRSASSLPRTRHNGETLEFDCDCSKGHKQKVETTNIAQKRKGRPPKKRQKRSRKSMPNLSNIDVPTDEAATLSSNLSKKRSASSLSRTRCNGKTLDFNSDCSEGHKQKVETKNITQNRKSSPPKKRQKRSRKSMPSLSNFDVPTDEAATLSSNLSKKRSASSLSRTRCNGKTLDFDSDCSEGHKQKVETKNITQNRKSRPPKKRQKRSRKSMPSLSNFDDPTERDSSPEWRSRTLSAIEDCDRRKSTRKPKHRQQFSPEPVLSELKCKRKKWSVYNMVDKRIFKMAIDTTTDRGYAKAVARKLARRAGSKLNFKSSSLGNESCISHTSQTKKLYSPENWLNSKLFMESCEYDE